MIGSVVVFSRSSPTSDQPVAIAGVAAQAQVDQRDVEPLGGDDRRAPAPGSSASRISTSSMRATMLARYAPRARLIVDDQDLHDALRARQCPGASGTSTRKIVRPSRRPTPMVQPKPRTSRSVTARPSPMLPSLLVTKGLKI